VNCPGNCEQRCNETSTGFLCYCQPGYQPKTLETNKCEDVDECTTTNDCHFSALCTNTVGSYVCSCPQGYSGDGKSPCVALPTTTTTLAPTQTPNEVKFIRGKFILFDMKVDNVPVDPNDARLNDTTSQLYKDIVTNLKQTIFKIFENITSTTISVDIISIKAGTPVDVTGSSTTGGTPGQQQKTVTPIDVEYRISLEGSFNTPLNNVLASLKDQLSSNLLSSPYFSSSVLSSGITLQDEDECASGINRCSSNAYCTNTLYSYTCTCNNGYEGDGFTCTKKDDDLDLLVIILPIIIGGLILLLLLLCCILAARRRRRHEVASEASDSIDGGSHIWAPSSKMRARSMYLPSGIVSTHYRDMPDDG